MATRASASVNITGVHVRSEIKITRMYANERKSMKTDKQKGNRVCSIVQLSTERLPNLTPPATHTHLLPFSFHSFIQSVSRLFSFPTLDSQMVGSDLHVFA